MSHCLAGFLMFFLKYVVSSAKAYPKDSPMTQPKKLYICIAAMWREFHRTIGWFDLSNLGKPTRGEVASPHPFSP